jgi:hypothetical protein
MQSYITSRDHLFPLHADLWLLENTCVPTRSWFIHCLQVFFPPDIAGQSLHAGGTTALAEAGAPPELIKGAGCWSSMSFERYIRKNPVLLHTLILARTSHYDT